LLNPTLLKAEKARRSLSEYIRQAWHVVEPLAQYTHGWHIDAIAEHLEAVTAFEIRNLIINVPPRHMKSLSVAVFWPTWVWATKPGVQWLFASYGEHLATRDSLKCRRLIRSPWYQERWGDVYSLRGDQNRKTKYENDKGGHRIAVGVGGPATGEGGDIIAVDDPHKLQDANSEANLETACTWWDETMSTRSNNPKTVCKVIVMQRLHERDLTGHQLAKMLTSGEHYEHLCLPAEYEKRVYISPLGWEDPRKEPGQLLWAERFGPEELKATKAGLGSERAIAGQLQQRPAPAGGTVYKKEWWREANRYDPEVSEQSIGRWLSIDTAMKDERRSNYTACSVFDLQANYRVRLSYVWRERLAFPQLIHAIETLAARFNTDDKLFGIIIEDRASGTSAFQTLLAAAPDWLRGLLIAFMPQGSKLYRARQGSVWCERGCVLLPLPSAEVPWLFEFEDELFKFPGAAYDDMEDTFTQGIIYLEHYLAEGYRASFQRQRRTGKSVPTSNSVVRGEPSGVAVAG